MPPDPPAVEAIAVSRTYRSGGSTTPGVVEVSLSVERGEVVAVVGPSGSGKSTLLFLLAGLDRPDGGFVRIAGTPWSSLRGAALARFRLTSCSFVAQGSGLLAHATAAENVEVPLLLARVPEPERTRRVAAALAGVELTEHAGKLTDQLSGGQQQRVALARALVTEPVALLADEPTGNLDTRTGGEILALIRDVHSRLGCTVVIVTHDMTVAQSCQRTVALRDGRIVEDHRR